ncbi:MAG: amidohydrolase [Vulcanimicrobiota bacterium]
MKNSPLTISAFFLLLAVFISMSPLRADAAKESADYIFKNGEICSVDSRFSWAEAVAIRDGKILAVGTDSEIAGYAGEKTVIIDLKGKMVLPGFCDSHLHPILGGLEMNICSLYTLLTKEEVYRTITTYVQAHPEKKWIVGSGWETPVFPGGSPNRADLDRIVPDRPAVFLSADGHSAWANSKALSLAGVDRKTPDPPGGRIERDPRSGEPSGTFREKATQLVMKMIPPFTRQERVEGLKKALKLAGSFGITSMVEANADNEKLEVYREMEQSGRLTAHISASLNCDPGLGVAQIEALCSRRARYQSPRIRTDSVKLFVDGVMETHTAALLKPYCDRPGDPGKLLIEPGPLAELVTALDRKDFQVHVHAIGDRAVRVSLDAFERAYLINKREDARHHIAHLELIDCDDIPRFHKLNVIANIQAFWAACDIYITTMTLPILGEQRSRWLYPFGSLVKSGAVIAAGSDWCVSSMNPLDAMEVAVTRRHHEKPEEEALYEEEALDLKDILKAYTINGAYVRHQEKVTGSLEAGKAADIVILDRNIFKVKPEEIHTVKVLLTMIEGKPVFRHDSFSFPKREK